MADLPQQAQVVLDVVHFSAQRDTAAGENGGPRAQSERVQAPMARESIEFRPCHRAAILW